MRALLLALILTLAACGRVDRSGMEAPAAIAAAGMPAVTAAQFGDADPHPWTGRAPSAYSVHGTDASRYQTAIDWAEARANGVNFAFLKATEGADDVDPMFARHWQAARAAGVPVGAYHFWYHCAPGAAQARNFIARVPRAAGALPPVLDLEWTPTSPTCTRRTPEAELLAEAGAFMDILERHYGQRPLVYVSPDIYHDRALWRLPRAEFWLRSVADHPSVVYPGQAWTFWQYSGTALIPGIAGRADANAFRGGPEAWAAWLAARTQ